MKSPTCYITIFTPTYNRKGLLERLYRSLREQTNKNFEWLIVDDDSRDATEEEVQKWMKCEENGFEIRYYRQAHGGKHRAINKAVLLAKGVYFFIVDSDDYLTADATEKIEVWGRLAEGADDIAGVSGLRKSNQGILGGIPKIDAGKEWIEAGNFERDKYHLLGDKAEAYKTKILKNYLFPEFENEYFVTEAVCWDAIAADGYKLRWYMEAIYCCEYLEDGLSRGGANGLRGSLENYRGYCYYISQCLRVKDAWHWSGNLRQYDRVARHMKLTWRQRARDLNIRWMQYCCYRIIYFPVIYSVKLVRKLLRK